MYQTNVPLIMMILDATHSTYIYRLFSSSSMYQTNVPLRMMILDAKHSIYIYRLFSSSSMYQTNVPLRMMIIDATHSRYISFLFFIVNVSDECPVEKDDTRHYTQYIYIYRFFSSSSMYQTNVPLRIMVLDATLSRYKSFIFFIVNVSDECPVENDDTRRYTQYIYISFLFFIVNVSDECPVENDDTRR